MRDPRLVRLGELIVSYSLGLEPGQILRVDVPPLAAPLGVELYRAALAAGSHPYANVELEQLSEILVKKGNDEQIEFLSPIAAAEIEFVDAIVTIWSESNTRALSRVPPDRHQR
ncbi:MAG: aminopeptidase, partial [Actinomycetota bacterium]|nr:aminopeptidase [Actinomycetota bacterium]